MLNNKLLLSVGGGNTNLFFYHPYGIVGNAGTVSCTFSLVLTTGQEVLLTVEPTESNEPVVYPSKDISYFYVYSIIDNRFHRMYVDNLDNIAEESSNHYVIIDKSKDAKITFRYTSSSGGDN